MSLTGFLKQSKEIRTLLKEHFPCPSVSFPNVQAPPLTGNYALVGQAFDYLLRFYMQRHNPCVIDRPRWIADKVDGASVSSFLERAHEHHERYLEDGKVTNELLGSCLDLAVIDGLVRSGEMRESLGEKDPKDIRDLRNLLALVPSTPFLDGSSCSLNPTLPFPSGADCDLIIDNTLIEIKTTKLSKMKQEYYQQLLGYYFLCLNNRGSRHFLSPNSSTYEIQRLGIYFSRHGYLWSIDLKDIANSEAFLQFLPRWNDLVQHYHSDWISQKDIPLHTLEELIAQVDALNGLSSYTHWLSKLNDADFALWKSWPTAPYYARSAIEMEQKRREKIKEKKRNIDISEIAGLLE